MCVYVDRHLALEVFPIAKDCKGCVSHGDSIIRKWHENSYWQTAEAHHVQGLPIESYL